VVTSWRIGIPLPCFICAHRNLSIVKVMKETREGRHWSISPSNIHGEGVFTNKFFYPGEKIDQGITFLFGFYPMVTRFGSKLNHSYEPNAVLRYNAKDHSHDVHARHALAPWTEVTLDYRDTPFYIKGPDRHFK
jgi:hypothetical protein